MSDTKHHLVLEKNMIRLHYIFSLLILLIIAGVLTAAFYLQVFYHELPCPLCLLQRVAFLGICFGIIVNLRSGFSMRHEGLTLLASVILLIISTRQTLLDIYPRPGHEYIGTAIFGLHMPVWSIVIATLLLLAFALRFFILGYGKYLTNHTPSSSTYPFLHLVGLVLTWYLILLCALNLLATFLQCSFGACHTFGYMWIR